MSTEETSCLTIPSITIREVVEDRKPLVKPLYKLKIEDLLAIPFNEETGDFRFKNNEISLVMFGGKIESISSDDSIFSFYVSDGTGEIQCYHKRKECITRLPDQTNKFSFLNFKSDTDIIDDISSSSDSDDEDISEETEDTVSKAYAKESEDIISDVLSWLNNEIIPAAAEESKNIGDIIHVSGQLQESGSVRKVSVIDFHMSLINFLEFFQKGKTFRPKKKLYPGTLRYSLHKQAQASLNSGINLRSVVQLPEAEDFNDWIAVHVVDFFNRINLIYGTISDFCTEESCPTMSGGPRFEYLWADGVKFKKPTKLSAPKYINLLMDWVEEQINNEELFPVSTNVPFPKNFSNLCSKILTRLFRVFVHVYIHHFDRIVCLGAEPHVNTCYKHFYYFVREFNLVAIKELEPLKEMTDKICRDKSPSPTKSVAETVVNS